ncbi:MAG: hypothetical protein AAF388_23835, partial [Bacteroidota bacterium]
MQRKSFCLSLLIFILSSFAFSQPEIEVCGEEYLIYVEIPDEDTIRLVSEPDLYPGGWDSLSSIHFWREAMHTPPTKSLVSRAKDRKILGSIPYSIYRKKRYRSQRRNFRDSLKVAWEIPDEESIYITQGRAHYYLIEDVLPQIDQSIPIFLEEGVDPWYAQA